MNGYRLPHHFTNNFEGSFDDVWKKDYGQFTVDDNFKMGDMFHGTYENVREGCMRALSLAYQEGDSIWMNEEKLNHTFEIIWIREDKELGCELSVSQDPNFHHYEMYKVYCEKHILESKIKKFSDEWKRIVPQQQTAIPTCHRMCSSCGCRIRIPTKTQTYPPTSQRHLK